MIRPLVTGSSKSGEDHAAGTLASPCLLPLYKSLSAQASSIFHEEWLIVFLLYWTRQSLNHLMYFMLPAGTCILLKNKPSCILCFWRSFYIFLTGTRQLLETKWVFYSKAHSDVHDSDALQQSQLIINIQIPVWMFLTSDLLLSNNLQYQVISKLNCFFDNITVHSRRERTMTVLNSILPINIWDRNSSMAWFWHT